MHGIEKEYISSILQINHILIHTFNSCETINDLFAYQHFFKIRGKAAERQTGRDHTATQ
jgi:hypothetical protein